MTFNYSQPVKVLLSSRLTGPSLTYSRDLGEFIFNDQFEKRTYCLPPLLKQEWQVVKASRLGERLLPTVQLIAFGIKDQGNHYDT